jgi:hybrid cluster-associated redox disulfide protein
MPDTKIDLHESVYNIMRRWPPTVQVFLDHHLGCVGCSMASFDTLADVLRTYNLPEASFTDALEASIQDNPDQPKEL